MRRPRRNRSFASPGTIRFLAQACLVIGVIGTIAGLGYAINGATQAKGYVVVPVAARTGAVLEAPGDAADGAEATRLLPVDDAHRRAVRLEIPGAAAGNWLEAHADALTLRSWGSTVAEQLFNRGGVAVLGLCAGVGALLLRRLLLSVAEGRPFAPGNAARLAGIAGLTLVGSLASDFLPAVGANLVLRRVGLAGADSPIFADFTLSLAPLLVAPLLLALAEAFRRGTELAQDAEGLI
ncbi:MAG TPA: DUF2975 domain-containing protein [Acidimicrobiales bacterium]|nr:DUF2975 domain-containing protein [Acidimicrobiales bacterium]